MCDQSQISVLIFKPLIPCVQYKLTKVVIVYPRFIIKNEAELPICLREDVSDQMTIVKPGKRALLSLFMRSADPQLVLAFESPMGKRW
jgi:vacuolar protein sorting-associated protein 13A/C